MYGSYAHIGTLDYHILSYGYFMKRKRTNSFHLLAKPTGAACNLDCGYCFFLSKEMLYPGSRFRMADELLEEYIRQLLEAHNVSVVTIAWQGGEPMLMGLPFFQRSIEYVEKHRKRRVSIEYTIQTNATLIDDEWAAFFEKHDFLVGVSVDGPRPIHDKFRVDKGGQPTFDKVMQGIQILQRHGVAFNTLTTLHSANATQPLEIYRFLRDECQSGFLQFIPIIERVNDPVPINPNPTPGGVRPESLRVFSPWSSWRDRPLYTQQGQSVTDRSVTPEQYGEFLIGIFEEWVRHDVGSVYVQMFDVSLASWVGESTGLCVHSKTCGEALALEHNGDLYSCDHFVEPAYKLGNILEQRMSDLVALPQQRKFGLDKFDTLPHQCRACDVRFVCHGGCPKDRFTTTASGEPGLNYLCAGYKRFFTHIREPMKIMAELIRHHRSPSEIMRWYAQKDASATRGTPV